MVGYSIQIFICLVGLLLVGFDIFLLKNKVHRRWSVSVVVVGLLLITGSFLMGRWGTFQCAFTVPDRIKIVGHVKGNSDSYLNNYLVILYRVNDEISRAVTEKGKFNGDRNDNENDGYFVLEIPNMSQLSRCSMVEEFRQDYSEPDFLSFGNHTTYIWHNFTDLGTGTSFPINKNEGGKIYTLVVLPRNIDNYPEEIKHYPTYLDYIGRVAVNVPIKMYRFIENSVQEKPTEYFVQDNPTANTLLLESNPAAGDVQDAWVADGSTNETLGTPMADDEIIDIDNCGQPLPRNETVKARMIYIHEIQFLEDNNSSLYDLGKITLKAVPSLGFTQGLVDTKDATENVDVPAGTHMKYLFYWQEKWENGQIVADADQNMIPVYFRARKDMQWYLTSYRVDCP